MQLKNVICVHGGGMENAKHETSTFLVVCLNISVGQYASMPSASRGKIDQLGSAHSQRIPVHGTPYACNTEAKTLIHNIASIPKLLFDSFLLPAGKSCKRGRGKSASANARRRRHEVRPAFAIQR